MKNLMMEQDKEKKQIPIVELSKKEINDCESAGAQRHRLARQDKLPVATKDDNVNMKIDNTNDLVGIKGELAVAKLLEIDFNPFQFGVDTGIDLFVGDWSIDVKTAKMSFREKPNLLFNSDKMFRSDLAILVTQESENTFGIAGWLKREEWAEKCEEHRRFDGSSRGSYKVGLEDLHHIFRLVYLNNMERLKKKWLKENTSV